MTLFNDLPLDVQNKVKSDLGIYDTTHVIYEKGKYNVSAGVMLCDKYESDHAFIGSYNAVDVFTKDEHIRAQIMAFGYSPTYSIYFYPNKEAWKKEAWQYEDVRNAYVIERINEYKSVMGCDPSKEWINNI